jgi:hypothetical protein
VFEFAYFLGIHSSQDSALITQNKLKLSEAQHSTAPFFPTAEEHTGGLNHYDASTKYSNLIAIIHSALQQIMDWAVCSIGSVQHFGLPTCCLLAQLVAAPQHQTRKKDSSRGLSHSPQHEQSTFGQNLSWASLLMSCTQGNNAL